MVQITEGPGSWAFNFLCCDLALTALHFLDLSLAVLVLWVIRCPGSAKRIPMHFRAGSGFEISRTCHVRRYFRFHGTP